MCCYDDECDTVEKDAPKPIVDFTLKYAPQIKEPRTQRDDRESVSYE